MKKNRQKQNRRGKKKPRRSASESRPNRQKRSRSQKPPADKVELLEHFDNYSGLRNGLRSLAKNVEEWCGIPIPLEDQRLIVEPSYPFAFLGDNKGEELPDGVTVRNVFWSKRKRRWVYIWQEPDGRILHGFDYQKRVEAELKTLGASVVWGVEQEQKALQNLADKIPHHQFKQYLMTGMFLESSLRSKVTYLFRRLRPTVALKARGESIFILCSLCMHPIGYYEGSWAGAMCPTDDVLAHLMLMRGDEHLYWRRCTQHPSHRPDAGI